MRGKVVAGSESLEGEIVLEAALGPQETRGLVRAWVTVSRQVLRSRILFWFVGSAGGM